MAKKGKKLETRTTNRAAGRPGRKTPSGRAKPLTGVAAAKKKAQTRPRKPSPPGPLFAPVEGAEQREVGHVRLEVARAGAARVKRMIYPPGFRWAVDMKPAVGTDLCMHAHVGFLAHGEIRIAYADGCVVEYRAPRVVAIDPGHDGWVTGDQPAVLIEFDFERDTVARMGMPGAHRHA